MSAYQNSEEFETSYVFKDVDEELARYLYSFWKDYHHEFWNNPTNVVLSKHLTIGI